MASERSRIEEDLRGQLAGDVRCDEAFVALYASDASIYQRRPLGVVRPRTVADVVATLRYAAEHRLPVHARGSGSSHGGGALGAGLIVDFSRHFRRIVADHDDVVTVEAGVPLERLQRRLARRGRQFAPDPANRAVSTAGGAIARDASGSRWLAYGSTHRYVRELEAVLADGSVVRWTCDDAASASPESSSGRLAAQVADIVARYADRLPQAAAAPPLGDRRGYALRAAANGDRVDLSRLLVGSEGTLGLITSATLATTPLPEHVGVVMLMFGALQAAAEASVELVRLPLRACDLLDRRHVSLARDLDPRYELMIPPSVEAVLLAEVAASSADRLAQQLRDIERLAVDRRGWAAHALTAAHPDDCAVLWNLVDQAAPRLYQLRGSTRALPLLDDLATPTAAIPEFLQRALNVLRKHQVTASLYVQAGSGSFHLRPLLDLASDVDRDKMQALVEEIHAELAAVGGVAGGPLDDSDSTVVTDDVAALTAACCEVKRLFDPLDILNPGQKVRTGRVPLEVGLRRTQSVYDAAAASSATGGAAAVRTFPLQLEWTPAEMAHAARTCNGCAACRTQEASSRMCPIFRQSPREEASPRAKANLTRALLTGDLPAETRRDDACKELADLCVHCHMCRVECPSNVDVPKLMMELKADYIATNGLDLHDRALAHIDRLCGWASRAPRTANWLLRNRAARWLLEKTLGIAQGRKLPQFSTQPFLHSSAQRKRSRLPQTGGEHVALFVDTFANYFDAQLARAAVAVLEHNGVGVYVPGAQLQAGMPLISQGVLEPARRIAERNASLLAEAVRQGCAIVATEPSAVLALRREYLHLLPDDSDARIVADSVYDLSQYLWTLHQRGRLRLDFQPLHIEVGYHTPCHVRALEIGAPAVHLLNLIPGLRVRSLEQGCSGIAGLYGFRKTNYRTSLRAGLALMNEVRTGRFAAGATDCSTCRIQMEQGAAKPTLHPAKIMALAYGLMPELHELLRRTNEPLVVR